MLLRPSFEKYAGSLPRVSAGELEKYEAHFALLQSWNEKMNLVSRKSIERAFALHYADSLHIVDGVAGFLAGKKVADLGTGGGFPGIVFAIRCPETPITLYEKSVKKQTFLSVVISQLNLRNVRLEGNLTNHQEETLLFARAVLPPLKLFPILEKAICPGSLVVHNVGGAADAFASPRGFKKVANFGYELPEGEGNRRVVVFQR